MHPCTSSLTSLIKIPSLSALSPLPPKYTQPPPPTSLHHNSMINYSQAPDRSQPLPDFVVPDRYCAIRPARSERIVNGVENEGVHGPDVVDFVDRLAMSLEGILLGLGGRGWVKVLDCYATFCRRCCVA